MSGPLGSYSGAQRARQRTEDVTTRPPRTPALVQGAINLLGQGP